MIETKFRLWFLTHLKQLVFDVVGPDLIDGIKPFELVSDAVFKVRAEHAIEVVWSRLGELAPEFSNANIFS